MNQDSVRVFVSALEEEEMSVRRFAQSTKRSIRLILKRFLRWASQRATPDVLTLKKKDMVSFFQWISSQNSPRSGRRLEWGTVRQYMEVVRHLYSILYRRGMIQENPWHNLELNIPSSKEWRRRPLTGEEVTRFLESIDTRTATGLRDRCLFELMYSSGLRVNEAACLKAGDVDLDRRLMVVRGKFSKDRMVPFSQVAKDFLVLHLGERQKDLECWVFAGQSTREMKRHLSTIAINVRFRGHMKALGMASPEVTTHSIRHSTATHLLENGASVRHVQELLGHANIESTARYTHVMTDSLAKVYRRHHPRERELFEEVDGSYLERLAKLSGAG
jgi:integrase/recombinase XerD